jgi:hypothetical protein
VVIISGGFKTCNTQTHELMLERLRQETKRLEAQRYPIKYILTCFTGAFPTERMVYYSIENGVTSQPYAIKGGKYFEADFNDQFLNRYLPQEIPKGAKVIAIGQSHGGWVSLAVTASRRVDFLATLDPISRTDCNLRVLLSLGGLRHLRDGSCNQPTSQTLLANVEKSIALNQTEAYNIYQLKALPQSGPLGVPGIKDIDLGISNPAYARVKRHPPLNPEPHVALATDPGVWRSLLARIDGKMDALDASWAAKSETNRIVRRDSGPTRHR